jgi:hypothetical protein
VDSIIIRYAERTKLMALGVLKDDRVTGDGSDVLGVWDRVPDETKPRVSDIIDLTADADRTKLMALDALNDDRVTGDGSDVLGVWDRVPDETKPRVSDTIDLTADADDDNVLHPIDILTTAFR